ncbi:hypothetical protein MHM582_2259 [Microbacterium sp. HM58-2]|nr:hypothetical protein MHM582_2259 [Microbacterium sp. HM58-2]
MRALSRSLTSGVASWNAIDHGASRPCATVSTGPDSADADGSGLGSAPGCGTHAVNAQSADAADTAKKTLRPVRREDLIPSSNAARRRDGRAVIGQRTTIPLLPREPQR